MSYINYKDFVYQMQYDRYNVFESQDHEKGQFDVKFVIQGKEIYANKFVLMPVSEPMAAMLSERWSNKDEPVKIESYNYDNFCQFLCFIYIGGCNLTNDNIREMVDLAEFFAVPCFKKFCDGFLSKMKFAPESIEVWYDFAQQYSLPAFTASIKNFIHEKGDIIIRENNFSSCKKPFVKFFSGALNGNFKEEFFEAAYDWSFMKHVNDGIIDLQEKIKTELYTIVPRPEFAWMKFEFLMNFVVEHGFYVSPSDFFVAQLRTQKEIRFKWTYELAEKQALKKQSMASENGESFNVTDSIKIDLAEVMPHVTFQEMDKQFLIDFVAEKGFILSATELYQSFTKFENPHDQQFKYVYQIAEKQALQKQKISCNPDNFNLADSIKNDLSEVMPHVHFEYMRKEILLTFVLEKGFLLSPTDFSNFFLSEYKISEEQKLESVYELVVKQASKKQFMASDGDNFSLLDSIKADMAEVLPHVKFHEMDKKFLAAFVVANGILSEEQASHVFNTRVEVKNGVETLTGFFVDNYGIRRKFESDHGSDTIRTKIDKLRYNKVKIPIPKTPSTVMKMKGVNWYLCLERDGVFAIKHHRLIERSDYLIAQMKEEENHYEFRLDPKKHIIFTFSNNV